MKKFLSLVLALVMTMSLVTISAGAKDFTDDSKINYDEAVAVMSAVKVLDGYTDGSFNPQGGLSRQAAAKIICNMVLGPTTAAELHADTAPYKDVPTSSDFAGYIAYCAKEGFISGYADGTFRPTAPLTGYAFMKMLLGALGYDQNVEGYTGANWSINVAKQAIGIGLNAGLKAEFSGIKNVTREEAALYAFNTLKADLVEYDSKTSVTVGGAEVVIAGSEAKAQRWNNSATKIENIKKDNYIQFAEQYFTKLTRLDGSDAFGRPANVWSFNKTDIGTFVDYTQLVASYTASVKGKEIYSDIGSVACAFALTRYVDGVESSTTVTNAEAAKLTKTGGSMAGSGNGVQTEVYVDVDAEETTIVVINTYLAKALTDYNEKTGKVTIEYYDGVNTTGATPAAVAVTKRLSDEDFDIADMEEGDFLTVNVANGVVEVIGEPEVVSNAYVGEYSTSADDSTTYNGKVLSSVIADGTTYKVAKKAGYDVDVLYDYNPTQQKLDGHKYDLYLDAYGYVLGIEEVETKEDFFFVVGYESGSSVLAQTIDKALVIFPDGTMKTVNAKEKGTYKIANPKDGQINEWMNYTVDEDGVYVISGSTEKQFAAFYTGAPTNLNISDISATLPTTVDNETSAPDYVYGNDASTYITVKVDDSVLGTGTNSIVDVKSVITGIKNVDIDLTAALALPAKNATETWNETYSYTVFGLYDSKGYVTYAIAIGEDNKADTNFVYLTSGITSVYYDTAKKANVYRYDAIVDGELTSVKSLEAVDTATNQLKANELYQATYDKDGFITSMVKKTATVEGFNTAGYKQNGYNVADVTVGNTQKFTLSGAMLYLDAGADNTKYAIIGSDCKFFVNGKDDTDGEYNEYGTVSAMLAALGKGHEVTGAGKIVVIADKTTGYAKTVIVLDAVFEQDAITTPSDGWTADARYGAWKSTGTNTYALYVNKANVTVADMWGYTGATGTAATTVVGSYYTTDASGIRTYHEIKGDSTATILSLMNQDGANIAFVAGVITQTVVISK